MMIKQERFVLQAFSSDTGCIVSEEEISANANELFRLLDIDPKQFRAQGGWQLEPQDVERLANHLKLKISVAAGDIALRSWLPIDELPYKVHTNRELILMLEGSKPLAVFSSYVSEGDECYAEQYFEPFVEQGRIIKREVLSSENEGIRHVLFALPGEEWRIDEYVAILESAKVNGWNESLQKREGFLLGYQDWQIDAYIELCRRKCANSGEA